MLEKCIEGCRAQTPVTVAQKALRRIGNDRQQFGVGPIRRHAGHKSRKGG
jgi:hypothetical protein